MANHASKVIEVALAEEGYLEKETNYNLDSKTSNAGDNNYTKYARDFDEKYPNFYNTKKQSVAWCDIFVGTFSEGFFCLGSSGKSFVFSGNTFDLLFACSP